MGQKTILDLNHFCHYEIFKQIRKNCEKEDILHTLEHIKYKDLINFIISCKQIGDLFFEWDSSFYRSIYLLYISSATDLTIDFAELYTLLKVFPAKVKDSYYKSIYFAIEENDSMYRVELKYTLEQYHSEHMEVFATVMNRLRRKKSIETLKVHDSVYTMEDLSGFGSLKVLFLDVRVDVEELCRCCCINKNLRELTILNNDMMGQRLSDIATYCRQVSRFYFKMKYDCDATEYAPLAKMPNLQQLKISGGHESGTLEPLFAALAIKEPKVLRELSLIDALLDFNETMALSQIEYLSDLSCGFRDPQSIEPISEMIYLRSLEVLSEHEFRSISQQIYRVLKNSQWQKGILLRHCKIDYNPKGNLRLILNNAEASDYGALLTLPRLKCLEFKSYFKMGTLVELFNVLKSVQISSLIIDRPNPFTMRHKSAVRLLDKGWQLRLQNAPVIKSEEITALSTCRYLKKLVCGFLDTENLYLLKNLLDLKELTITIKPLKCSLQGLFAALASREDSCLEYFRLSRGSIGSLEAEELARIKSLKVVKCGFFNANDIGKMSHLAKQNLNILEITSLQDFHETSTGILKVLKSSENEIFIRTQGITIKSIRKLNFIGLQMDILKRFTDNNLLVPLANVDWMENLLITVKRGNLRTFFKALSMRGILKKLEVRGGSLDFDETLELVNMMSLKKFHGTLTDSRSIQHLRHLSHIGIEDSRFPKNMVNIFNTIQNELTISIKNSEISFNIKTGRLTLCNAFSFEYSTVSEDIAPLVNLKNLKSVRVIGDNKGRSLEYFLAQLASKQRTSLKELIIEKTKDDFEPDVINLSAVELKEVSAIMSLKTLKCGFLDHKDLELLANIPKLTNLIVGLDQENALKSLLRKRRLNDIQIPESLPSNGQISFEIRSQEMSIKEMIITKEQGDLFFLDFFKMLVLVSRTTLQRLIVKGLPIVQNEAEELSKIESLQNLIYRFSKLQDIQSLVKLSELTTFIIGCRNAHMSCPEEYEQKETLITRIPDHITRDLLMLKHFQGLPGVAQHLDRQRLFIELPREVISLKRIFEPLPEGLTHTLQELVITYRYLDFEEVNGITQITSLRKLRCGLHDAISFSLLPKLCHLESLEVKSYPKFMDISEHLVTCLQECPKINSIDLHFTAQVQLISETFVQRAIEALKIVRNPKVRAPLKLSCFVSQVFIEPEAFIDEEYLSLSINEKEEDRVLWIYYRDRNSF